MRRFLIGVVALFSAGAASAQEGDAALAQQLTNPVANLISVPLQHNFDFGGGPDDNAFRYLLNVQPAERAAGHPGADERAH